jgi:hypothetical protein
MDGPPSATRPSGRTGLHMAGVMGSGILGAVIAIVMVHPAQSYLGSGPGLIVTGVIAIGAVLVGVTVVNRFDPQR